MDLQLNGWRTLVTGATAGIGAAIATDMVREGASVVGTGREPGGELPAGVIGGVYDDIRDESGPERMVSQAVEMLGGLDAVVCAAGSGIRGTVEDTSEETWQEGLAMNLMSAVRLARNALPALREHGGRIVFVSALSGLEPRENHAVSNAAKAGLHGLAKSLSREVGHEGILVNCVAPGRIMSRQVRRAYPEKADRDRFAAENIPVGRFGEAGELAPFATLLASPLNRYVTGQILTIDGGMSKAM